MSVQKSLETYWMHHTHPPTNTHTHTHTHTHTYIYIYIYINKPHLGDKKKRKQ